MNIKWMPQKVAETLIPSDNACIISITSPEVKRNLPYWKYRLDLEFYDFSKPYQDYIVFTPQHAHQILNFVNSLPLSVTTIYIHCRAGISRSATIGLYLQKMFGQPYNKTYDFINPLIWGILSQEIKEQDLLHR
jgi:predicted protein tyrosine phosphatase